MNIGKTISSIRKGHNLTQEEFGNLFHVTRQAVSGWENEKSYPDLETLIAISDKFEISLDKLIKEDLEMVRSIDNKKILGTIRREKAITDFFIGAGVGIIISAYLTLNLSRKL